MMKKVFVIITCLLSCMLLLSCTNIVGDKQADPGPKAENDLKNTDTSIGQTDAENYALYELDEYDSAFNTAIKNNRIDADYRQEINLATTNNEFIQVELKYISIWEEELDSSIKKYTAALSEEDHLAFQMSQDRFIEYYKTSTSYDEDMLLHGKYGINLGTSTNWLLYVNKRELLRERTIHVKYLHFLLERVQENTEEFLSLRFDA